MKKEHRIINELFHLVGECQTVLLFLKDADSLVKIAAARYKIHVFCKDLERKINLLLEDANLTIDDEVEQVLNEIKQI